MVSIGAGVIGVETDWEVPVSVQPVGGESSDRDVIGPSLEPDNTKVKDTLYRLYM